MDSLPPAQQRLAALKPLGGIQERTASDAHRPLGLLGGEDRLARHEQTADMARQGGPLVVKQTGAMAVPYDASRGVLRPYPVAQGIVDGLCHPQPDAQASCIRAGASAVSTATRGRDCLTREPGEG